MKEAKFLKNLSNPNLIQLYLSFFEQNERGTWYFMILMEYAKQGDLLK
jgi:serine/threonine protein kinase